MDEFNNDRNPFDEQNSGQGDSYAQQEQPTQNVNPYQQGTASNADPYNQQPQQNPYNQPNQGYYNQQTQNSNQYQQNPNYYNPYAQQGGWQGMQQAQFNAARQSTGMATASLVLGIISIVLCLPAMALPFLFLVPIIGLILGIVYKTKHLQVGKGISTAGIITSILGIVLPIVFLVISVVFVLSNPDYVREYLELLKQTNPDQYQEYYDQLSGVFPEWFESVLYFIFK